MREYGPPTHRHGCYCKYYLVVLSLNNFEHKAIIAFVNLVNNHVLRVQFSGWMEIIFLSAGGEYGLAVLNFRLLFESPEALFNVYHLFQLTLKA